MCQDKASWYGSSIWGMNVVIKCWIFLGAKWGPTCVNDRPPAHRHNRLGPDAACHGHRRIHGLQSNTKESSTKQLGERCVRYTYQLPLGIVWST